MRKLRQVVKQALLDRNIYVSRPAGQFSLGPHRLKRLQSLGLQLEGVIDAGAATGAFAQEVLELNPLAHLLCVEPRPSVQPQLEALRSQHANVQIATCALGAEQGAATFYDHGAQSSLLLDTQGTMRAHQIDVTVETLDDVVAAHNFESPKFLKLDLQGGELGCLRGATRTVESVEAILTECSFVPIYEEQPLMAQMVAVLDTLGFACFDVLALWQRPLDGIVAQGDFLFVKTDHPLMAPKPWTASGGFGN